MAKRKRRSSKKKQAEKAQLKAQHILPDGWWQQVVSIIIGLTALLLTLAIFNLAGPMPSGLLASMRTLFGYGAFVLPLVLFVLMFQKFITEDNRLALSVYFGAVVFMADHRAGSGHGGLSRLVVYGAGAGQWQHRPVFHTVPSLRADGGTGGR